jgi:multidrug efflux pump subunit AcrA (membrane-fusion protein)
MPAPADAASQAPAAEEPEATQPHAARAPGPGFTDAYDTLIRVTRPPAWIALAALLVVIAAIAVWSVFGATRQTVDAPGIVVPPGGVRTVDAPAAGRVQRIEVGAGDRVRAGQPLATIAGASGPVVVRAPAAGTVIQPAATVGADVAAGDTIVLTGSTSPRREVVAFAPFGESGRIEPGQRVELTSLTQAQDYLSNVDGRVRAVTALPVSPGQIADAVGNPQLADQFAADGAVAMVTIALPQDAAGRVSMANDATDAGGFGVGALVDTSVIVASKSPLSQVFD